MHFVDDVHFVLARNRRVLHVVHDVADLIHAVVRSRVQFDNIDIARARKRTADFALAARRAVNGAEAVDRARENPRAGRLARAAAAREKIRVSDVTALDLIDKRARDVFLRYYVPESRGAVFSVQCQHVLALDNYLAD